MRTRYSLLNMAVGVAGQFVSIFLAFFSRTVFIHYLSAEYLGINGVFTNVLGILSLAELGIGSAMIYSLYKPAAEDDKEEVSKLMNLYCLLYRGVALVVLVLGLALLPFLDYLIKGDSGIAHLRLIYLMYLANSVCSYLLSYKNSILLAHQKAYYRVAWEHSIHLVQIIGQIIVLVLTQNFILYLVLQMLNQVTVNVIVARKVDKEYPYLKEQKALPDRETCREISKNILAMSMHRLGGVVVNGTDNLMMSAFVGLASAGIYSNYQLVLTNINNVLGKIYNGFSSSIGNLAATEGSEKIYGIYKNLNFLMFALYGYLSVGLFVLLNPFIEMIFGKEYLFSMVMVLVMVLNFYIAGMRQITLQFRSAMGLFWRDRFKPVAEAVINLVVSILLVQKYGVIGILVGTIVSSLTTCCWVEPYIFIRYGIQKGWQEKLRSYFIEYLLRFLLVASAAGISYVLCGKLPGGGILWFVLKGMICTGIYGLFLLLTYGRSEEFGYFMEKGLEFLKKCRKKKEEK